MLLYFKVSSDIHIYNFNHHSEKTEKELRHKHLKMLNKL